MQIRAAVAAAKSQPFSIEMPELEDDQTLINQVLAECARSTHSRRRRSGGAQN
jgi:hypothetical protein